MNFQYSLKCTMEQCLVSSGPFLLGALVGGGGGRGAETETHFKKNFVEKARVFSCRGPSSENSQTCRQIKNGSPTFCKWGLDTPGSILVTEFGLSLCVVWPTCFITLGTRA